MPGLRRAQVCEVEHQIPCESIDHPKTPVHPLFTVPSGLYLCTNERVIFLMYMGSSEAEERSCRDGGTEEIKNDPRRKASGLSVPREACSKLV